MQKTKQVCWSNSSQFYTFYEQRARFGIRFAVEFFQVLVGTQNKTVDHKIRLRLMQHTLEGMCHFQHAFHLEKLVHSNLQKQHTSLLPAAQNVYSTHSVAKKNLIFLKKLDMTETPCCLPLPTPAFEPGCINDAAYMKRGESRTRAEKYYCILYTSCTTSRSNQVELIRVTAAVY